MPDLLSNKYSQYEEDANKFITWSVENAKTYSTIMSRHLPYQNLQLLRLA